MSDWKHEHGPGWDVPGFIQWLVAEDIIKDHSWHNDSDPSFGLYDKDGGNGLVIWVGHPLKSRREGATTRFAVQTIKDGSPDIDTDLNTDELEEALTEFFDRYAEITWLGDEESDLDWHELYQEYLESIE